MTQIYDTFKELLHQNGLHMKEGEQNDAWVFKGRLAVSDHHMVDFAVLLSKQEPSTYQVVFNNVAYCKDYNQQATYLEHINQFNAQQGVYYYLALDTDGRIFARHVHLVQYDVEYCVQILLTGVNVVRQAVSYFTKTFGEFVNV